MGGSSPRMRGALPEVAPAVAELRLIPAHAGSTQSMTPLSLLRKAHPRACGEHMLHVPEIREAAGSSPRMRGAPGKIVKGPEVIGLIPAHAGSTSFGYVKAPA